MENNMGPETVCVTYINTLFCCCAQKNGDIVQLPLLGDLLGSVTVESSAQVRIGSPREKKTNGFETSRRQRCVVECGKPDESIGGHRCDQPRCRLIAKIL